MANLSKFIFLSAASRAAAHVGSKVLGPIVTVNYVRQFSSGHCSTSCKAEPMQAWKFTGVTSVQARQLKRHFSSNASQSGAYVEATAPGGYSEGAPVLPKLVVFGGNGFVGSKVCEEALRTGLGVVSINRSGPPKLSAPWIKDVEWVRADVFDVLTWRSQLEGAIGVVSTLGAFGSNDFMFKICGESNIKVFEEAAAAGVPRASFISVHEYGLPDFVLSGYFKGKRKAEEALFRLFPSDGVALRPGFIYGTRNVSGVGIPLGLVGSPLEKVLSYLPTKSLAGFPLVGAGFVPPVSVEAVGRAAVTAATDSAVPAGLMDVWQIETYSNKV